jgi:nucleoside-diphosphate-sugar epimerase
MLKFTGRRIAVVGAAGRIGAHLCRSLHSQGASAVALDLKKRHGHLILRSPHARFEQDINPDEPL